MKRLLLAALPVLFFACAGQDRDQVVAIPRTRSYHTPLCSRVAMARIVLMPREEAVAHKLAPCPLCIPDRH